ncbi:VOC family protein [Confluentibacter sediminis]|uniref:VOC family protein n=1 Tax=Confluentibacter sediminis TaxID=2219045 RepID=UPI000DAD988A|nr:bleomycin resistance protein [Confluentibacter sediminis]
MDTSFHMSLPCLSVRDTKKFYTSIGASIGRSTQSWVDINLFGHQITFIKTGKFNFNSPNYVFEGKILPSFHFGVIVDLETWNNVYSKLKDEDFELVDKTTFLKNNLGEHTSFFVNDPNDYMLEFKSFKNIANVFES